MVGTGIDLGLGYAHRREVQNAADSAAVAGALALGRHYQYAYIGSGYTLAGLTDATDAIINQEIQYAAASGVPQYPDPSTSPSWPTGTGNTLTATYLLTDNATPPNITVGAAVGGGSIPATAAGVRVTASLRYDTIFARVLGDCCTQFSVTGQSDAQLRPLGNTDTGAPFIVCGNSVVDGGGAWKVAPAPTQIKVDILTAATPTAVDLATYAGDTFRVHDPQLGKNAGPATHNADCNAGDNYKGNADPTDTCNPVSSSSPVPCLLAGQNGTRAGPTRDRVAALPGCSGPSSADSCIVPLPIADGYDDATSQLHVVTWACFQLHQIDANTHDGTLMGACMLDGTAGTGAFDPTHPGAFVVKLTPQ
jgi:hypothetical protein